MWSAINFMTRGYRNNKTVCLLVSFFFFFLNHYWILCEKPGGIKNHFGACVCVLRVCMCVYLYFFFSEWNRGWQDVIFLCPVCMYFLLVRPLATMKQTTDSFFRKKKRSTCATTGFRDEIGKAFSLEKRLSTEMADSA